MSEQHKSEDANEPVMPDQEKSEGTSKDPGESQLPAEPKTDDKARGGLLSDWQEAESTDLLAPEPLKAAELKMPSHEAEWIPGEQLELIRIPPPTIWPVTLALGTTGIAFGVVTHWILSLAGLFLFLLGAKGWIEDLRNDVLQ